MYKVHGNFSIVKLVLWLSILTVLFIFVSCDPDLKSSSQGNGTLVYKSVTYSLSQGILEGYGSSYTADGSYDWDIILASSGINIINETGTGEYLYIDLNSPEVSLVPGIYTWNYTRVANSLVDGEIGIGYDAYNEIAQDWGSVTGGTVNIISVGSTYELEFTLYLDNGETVTGSYRGQLTLYDYD